MRGGDVLAVPQDVLTAVAALDRVALRELDADRRVETVASACDDWVGARGAA